MLRNLEVFAVNKNHRRNKHLYLACKVWCNLDCHPKRHIRNRRIQVRSLRCFVSSSTLLLLHPNIQSEHLRRYIDNTYQVVVERKLLFR